MGVSTGSWKSGPTVAMCGRERISCLTSGLRSARVPPREFPTPCATCAMRRYLLPNLRYLCYTHFSILNHYRVVGLRRTATTTLPARAAATAGRGCWSAPAAQRRCSLARTTRQRQQEQVRSSKLTVASSHSSLHTKSYRVFGSSIHGRGAVPRMHVQRGQG